MTSAEPLDVVFLDSWRPAARDGSGTAVGIATLALGLRRLGHDVTTIRPSIGSGGLVERLVFNATLPRHLRARERHGRTPDLVVGFDLDGVFLGGVFPRRPFPGRERRGGRVGGVAARYVVALKGVAWDEARFATSAWERRLLRTLGRLERRNARSADRVIVPSSYSAEVVCRMYDVDPERIAVVPEPIDIQVWDRMRTEARTRGDRAAEDSGPVVLSVARQYPRKNTAALVRAWRAVVERVPDALLHVIGGGPELPRLRRLVSELGLERSVTLAGEIPDDGAVHRAYFDADVFCLPSLQEGFGIVFLEAMAAGLPIVAARAGAAPELVHDGENGLLFTPGDDHALAGALVRLLEEPGLGARFGEEGRRRAAVYDLERVARRFLEASQSADQGA